MKQWAFVIFQWSIETESEQAGEVGSAAVLYVLLNYLIGGLYTK